MAKLYSLTSGLLLLPDETPLPPGGSITLPAKFAANAGVAAWVAEGLASFTDPNAAEAAPPEPVQETAPEEPPVLN